MIIEGKKVLITGGTGFIGKYVVRSLLAQGAEVICLTRQRLKSDQPNSRYIRCDLTKLRSGVSHSIKTQIGKVDFIIYMAASIPPISKNREDLIAAKENNLDTFLYFLSAFGELSEKIVFTSSIDVYGLPDSIDFDENAKTIPQTTYAIAKYCCEKYLEFYAQHKNKKYVILRLAQVYGQNEPLLRVTPLLIDAVLHNKEFSLNGSGEDKRRFLYAEDAALSIHHALYYPENEIFNIAGKEDIAILQAIGTIEKITHKKILLRQINSDKKPVHILPSFTKAKDKLSFCPRFTYEEGIRNIIDAEKLC